MLCTLVAVGSAILSVESPTPQLWFTGLRFGIVYRFRGSKLAWSFREPSTKNNLAFILGWAGLTLISKRTVGGKALQMDDFERIILVCLDPSTDSVTKAHALEVCQRVQESPEGLSFALQRLLPSSRPEIIFWCVQYLSQSVVLPRLNGSTDVGHSSESSAINLVRDVVFKFANDINATNSQYHPQPPYVRNKLAQLVAAMVAADYPATWPTAMRETVLPLASGHPVPSPSSVDFFFRVMRAIDEDVTSIRAAQASESARLVSVQVKDTIREDCATELVAILANLTKVQAYAGHAYDLLARNVEWLDISLFTNDAFLPHMYAAITSSVPCATRAPSAFALRAILLKRMPPQSKLALLQHLQVLALLKSIPRNIPHDSEALDGSAGTIQLPSAELSIQSGRAEIAALVNCIASITLDILKGVLSNLKNGNPAELAPDILSMIRSASVIAESALPLALRFVTVDDDESTSAEALHCVNVYISTFSRLNAFGTGDASAVIRDSVMDNFSWDSGREGLISTLNVIEERACFPPDYDPLDDEHPFVPLRHMLLKSVLRGIIRAAPSVVLSFVRRMASHPATLCSAARMELVYAILTLLAETSPNLPNLEDTLTTAMMNPPSFPCAPENAPASAQHQLEAVSIAYFEYVARCYRVVLRSQNPYCLESVLAPFFDSRGILHPTSESIRLRASQLLLKITRPLRTLISSKHMDAVMNAMDSSLFPVLVSSVGVPFTVQMSNFETVGYVLGTDPTGTANIVYLESLLQRLIGKLQHSSSVDNVIGIVTAVGQLSKGFGADSKALLLAESSIKEADPSTSNSLRNPSSVNEPAESGKRSNGLFEGSNLSGSDVKIQRPKPLSAQCVNVWTACLKDILSALGLLPENDSSLKAFPKSYSDELVEKIMFVLHRMVDVIGVETVPYLGAALPTLLQNARNASGVQSVVVLASQAVGKFAKQFEPLLTVLYPSIVSQVRRFPLSVDPGTRLAVSEEMRESAELQKSHVYLIHAVFCNDIHEVFVSQQNICLLHHLLSLLTSAVVGELLDVRFAGPVMKLCMSSLSKLTTLWINPDGKDLVVMTDEVSGQPLSLSQYLTNEIAPACIKSCVVSSLFRGGDYSSGMSVAVLTENITLQRTCLSRLGPNFVDALRSNGFSNARDDDFSTYVNLLSDTSVAPHVLIQPFLRLVQQQT